MAVLPAAAAPLVLSSARTATLHHQLDNTCAARVGFHLQSRAPATAAGVLIGLIVVAAAALYWVQRREREVRVLAAHGVGPPALAGKAVPEVLRTV